MAVLGMSVQPRRNSLTVLLLLTMAAILFQAAFIPPTAQAQTDRHRAGTFNMQGAPDRWQQGVYVAAKQVEVLALQEVPDAAPPDAELAAGAYVAARTPLAHGFTVDRYRWVNCRPPVAGQPQRKPCIIYKVRSLTRKNRSLAIVVNQPTDSVRAVQVIPPQPVVPGGPVDSSAKPALGIKLTDGTWFYSLHAQNRPSRTNQRNDAPNLISKISSVSEDHWAVMGDFNRTPDSLEPIISSDYPDTKIVRSGHFTYPVKGPKDEFDYMVARGLADNQYAGFRLTYLDASDHFPIGFWASPASGGHDFPCDPIDEILRASREGCVPSRNPAIVSMGDSYISGEAGRWAGNADTGAQGSAWGTDRAAANCSRGEATCDHDLDTVYGPTSYATGGNQCDRSDLAPITGTDYPQVPPWRRFNLACSGATTHEITHSYTEKDEDAQADQLAYIAKKYQVKMIVVSIGGNDLGFKDIITDCTERFMKRPFHGYCKNAAAWSNMSSRLDAVGEKVTQALKDIQSTMERAGYQSGDYRLLVQSNPASLPPSADYRYNESRFTRYTAGGCPFYDEDTDWARQTIVGGMSSKIRAAANTVNAKFLDLSDAFAGHELCNKTSHQATTANSLRNPLPSQDAEWIRWVPYLPGYDFLNKAPQGDIREAIHPNSFGQQALATCLTQVSRRPDLLNNTATRFKCVNDGRNGTHGMRVTGNGYLQPDSY
ncbi:hypothetical protein J2Z21_009372 [Streptomyces griseochromogenes]|uniref:SGNH hydrolase-type esterase domain-containing protein n=2 Tax=Streptomyces griseochromogenes TaxID=68214 RepID=A0ABS4M9K9_9ACTN|nr:GDSL-type esterase/lipase family protein [Streptomyces griseochromogenes]MBP2056354.1 hypothetical protein [Streptomyces griseochromogenes]